MKVEQRRKQGGRGKNRERIEQGGNREKKRKKRRMNHDEGGRRDYREICREIWRSRYVETRKKQRGSFKVREKNVQQLSGGVGNGNEL
jgi:hypothetical protein